MDIKLDSDYIPVIENGDFKADDSLQQEQKLLLATTKGEWKANPLVGCGVINSINDENPQNMIAEIKRQFKADGLKIQYLAIVNGELNIDAERS
jgi:hypothetical protein